MTIDAGAFKSALGAFTTGVCIVTAIGQDGCPGGITISAFTSVSLDPPLVLFCLGRKHEDLIRGARDGRFTINILAEDQEAVSETFASQRADKFEGIDHHPGRNGCAIIDGDLVALECTVDKLHDGGDHLIVVGHVDVLHAAAGKPLLRFGGRYLRLA